MAHFSTICPICWETIHPFQELSHDDAHVCPMAEINISEETLPLFETPTYRFTWIGERHWPVYLSDWLRPDVLKQIPWKLRKVGEMDVLRRAAVYVRIDRTIDYPWYWFVKSIYAFRSGWKWIKERTILTLVIWGVGQFHANVCVDWNWLRKDKTTREWRG